MKPRDIKSAGVVGSGTMGGGIAMCFANAGIPVTILETSEEALKRGLDIVAKNYQASAKRGGLSSEDVDIRLGLMTGTTDAAALGRADMVIEAVFEDMDVKRDVFGKLDQMSKPDAILATNTSYLDVNEIARFTHRPESVLGMHFFSPANVMRLLEIVRGATPSRSCSRPRFQSHARSARFRWWSGSATALSATVFCACGRPRRNGCCLKAHCRRISMAR